MNKKKNVLFFAYYSIKDPVFRSALLAYLLKMNLKGQAVLLTFENDRFPLYRAEIEAIDEQLKISGIIWYRLNWHSGNFKVFKKIYDLFCSLIVGVRVIKRHQVELIYSEGFPGALIADFLSFFSRIKHVVHTFEPHAEYMLEGSVWKKNSWEYVIARYFEKKVASRAKALITGTEAYKREIISWGFNTDVYVVPSAIDLEKFNYNQAARDNIRKSEGVKEDEIIFVYLGKFGGMYMEDEIFQFFSKFEKSGLKFRYWIFTEVNSEYIDELFNKYKIPTSKRLIRRLDQDKVGDHLSAADVGIVGVRPFPSKRFCSPIKTGEYWACGLPIIIPQGIGDDFIITKDEKIGIVAQNLLAIDLNEVLLLRNQPRTKARKIAIRYRDLSNAIQKIEKIVYLDD